MNTGTIRFHLQDLVRLHRLIYDAPARQHIIFWAFFRSFIMAQEEARTMLDTLMGADRNAPLPKGAAIPRLSSSRHSKKKKRDDSSYNNSNSDGWLSAPSKRRSASCYDPDIDPLFVAWGVDVYELFVNTKSDLGANPFNTQRRLADHESARQEYVSLPPNEKLQLGFEFQLFQKLSELVKSCDRIVQRNKEKLHQELQQKQRQKAAASLDYHVEVIEEAPLEGLVRNMIQLENLQQDIERLIQTDLVDITAIETKLKQELNDARKRIQEQQAAANSEASETSENNPPSEANAANTLMKEDTISEQQETTPTPESAAAEGGEVPVLPKSEPAKQGTDPSGVPPPTTTNNNNNNSAPPPTPFGSVMSSPEIQSLQMELGRLTLQKQKLLVDISYKIQHEYVPLKEAVEKQTNHLQQVKSDTTTDKTVCEVSGNFMSARDADERIAAHYAGKQYVGWKLVRSKFREMVEEYGRNGPPRPHLSISPLPVGGPYHSRSPPPRGDDSYHRGGGRPPGGGSGSGGRYDRDGRPSHDRGGVSSSNYRSGDRGGSGGGDRRRSGSGRRSPSPQYWERHGGSGHDRRGGGSQRGGNWRR